MGSHAAELYAIAYGAGRGLQPFLQGGLWGPEDWAQLNNCANGVLPLWDCWQETGELWEGNKHRGKLHLAVARCRALVAKVQCEAKIGASLPLISFDASVVAALDDLTNALLSVCDRIRKAAGMVSLNNDPAEMAGNLE